MTWDALGRLTTFYNGAPEAHARPTERYAYDAGGFRLVRIPESGSGRPEITLRAGTGRKTSAFVEDPSAGYPRLARDNIFVNGLLAVERYSVDSHPVLTSSSPACQSGSCGFVVQGGSLKRSTDSMSRKPAGLGL